MNDDFAPPPPSGDPFQPKETHPPAPETSDTTPVQPPPPTGAPASSTAPEGAPVEPPTGIPAARLEPAAPAGEPMSPVANIQPAAATEPPVGTPVPVQSTEPSMPAPVPGPDYGGTQSTATPYPGAGTTAPVKKKSKKPLIIVLASIAAVILIVAGVLIFQEVSRSNAYDQATANFNAGEYALAEEGFRELGDYRDSADMLVLSTAYKNYEEAKALFEEGDYSGAREVFVLLYTSGIPDIDEWVNKCDYAMADELFNEGEYELAYDAFLALGDYSDSVERANASYYALAEALYAEGDIEGAYEAFLFLGSYSDAADRAAACTQPFPASGILYQAEGSYYAYAAIEIAYNFESGGSYYKIYSGETLMATIFCNGNSSVRVYLQPGSYVIKEGTGDVWFGESLAFGKNGYYSTMIYDDSGNEILTLGDGDLVTITINSGTSGNVSERDEDLSTF